MRQKTVRGLLDKQKCGADVYDEYVRAEKHLCAECRPDGWVILYTFMSDSMEEETGINLRASAARELGEALIEIADELRERVSDKESAT